MMTIFIILLLIVLNGLFVAAEFALLGAPRAALEQMGASGNMVARRVSQILKTPRLQDRYIATAQLGIGMYGGCMPWPDGSTNGWPSTAGPPGWWRMAQPAFCP